MTTDKILLDHGSGGNLRRAEVEELSLVELELTDLESHVKDRAI